MTAADLLRCADGRGLALSFRSEDRILVRGRADVIGAFKRDVAAHKREIIALLRERAALATPDAASRAWA
jgi:hypothetical protein